MPELCRFHGAIIQIFPREHPPPHFHVKHAGGRARVTISDAQVVRGSLPPNIQRLVLEWARVRRGELETAWERIQRGQVPDKIAPLD